jgi:hypothetical protein
MLVHFARRGAEVGFPAIPAVSDAREFSTLFPNYLQSMVFFGDCYRNNREINSGETAR